MIEEDEIESNKERVRYRREWYKKLGKFISATYQYDGNLCKYTVVDYATHVKDKHATYKDIALSHIDKEYYLSELEYLDTSGIKFAYVSTITEVSSYADVIILYKIIKEE